MGSFARLKIRLQESINRINDVSEDLPEYIEEDADVMVINSLLGYAVSNIELALKDIRRCEEVADNES